MDLIETCIFLFFPKKKILNIKTNAARAQAPRKNYIKIGVTIELCNQMVSLKRGEGGGGNPSFVVTRLSLGVESSPKLLRSFLGFLLGNFLIVTRLRLGVESSPKLLSSLLGFLLSNFLIGLG